MKLERQISKQRSSAGLSLREVAEKSGVSHATVARAERGEAKLSVMLRIAKALGIDVKLDDVLRAA